jgi:D-alanyl-D-alanine carboxypeptidase
MPEKPAGPPGLVQAVAADGLSQSAVVRTALEKPEVSPAPPVYPGPFHIQIGAFADAAAAEARRERAESVAGTSLGKHPFFTMTIESGEGTLVRARFAGFEERQAKSVCASLKQSKIDCLILRAPVASPPALSAR